MYRRPLVMIVVLLALALVVSAAALGESPPAANTYTGTLIIVHSDSQNLAAPPIEQFYLSNDEGTTLELLVGGLNQATTDLYDLVGQTVTVTGEAAASASIAGRAGDAPPVLTLASIQATSGPLSAAPALTGNIKWLSIGCKFADVAAEPRDMAYFRGMYASTYPGLDHYWREASYGAMNVAGSTAVGWYTLPKPKSAYQIDSFRLKWNELFMDCAALADPEVNFAEYYGVHLMLNSSAHCCATSTLVDGVTLDNVTKTWPVEFIPPWGYTDIAVTQHEMAHGLGLRWHSYSGANAYGHPWDVLSDDMYGCGPRDPVYGCVGQHTIMYNRDYLGWIPSERKAIVGAGVTTLTLERATQPSPTGYLMAVVPIDGSSTHYYTIEARQKIGYDTKLPGASIVIHEVGGYQRLQLMDTSAAAGQHQHFWVVGDTWYAPVGNISVHLDAATATGFTVTVNTLWELHTVTLAPTGDTTLDQAAPNTNYGLDPVLRIEGSYLNPNGTTKALFLRFNPTQLPSRITRARLKLFSVGAIDGSRLEVVTAYKNGAGYGGPWDEQTLTWYEFSDQGWGFPAGVSLVYQPTASGPDWFEFDISGFMAVNGVETVNALLVDDFRDYPLKSFSSREGSRPPQLIVDYLVSTQAPTTTTFPPTNDATVSQVKPKLISGGKPTLQVKDAAKDLNAYVKFNVTGLSGTVQSATLRLWVTNGGPDGGRVYATSPFYLNTTTQWLETGLKWSNAPTISGAPLDAAGAVAAKHWIELDVTGAVTGNGRASFALTNDKADLIVYSSKEGAHAPELVIVTQ